jgi:hypothetical protein
VADDVSRKPVTLERDRLHNNLSPTAA